MHTIEPFHAWLKYYDSSLDDQSPFFEKEYNFDLYTETIYGYYIDPAWDGFGSETLYLKILYCDYIDNYCILEFIGEWNDAINNDIMYLKRNIVELLQQEGINKFILIGENIMNFHGSDDSYYEEWNTEVADEGGWIATIGFPAFVRDEMKRFQLHHYLILPEEPWLENWRTLQPTRVFAAVQQTVQRKLN